MPSYIPPTLSDAWQDFQLTRRLKDSTLADYRKRFVHFEDWLELPLTDISKDMVLERHHSLSQQGASLANLCCRILRSVLSHAIERFQNEAGESILRGNPVDILKQLRRWNPSRRRKTLIGSERMKAWWHAVNQSQSDTARDYLTFLLLTGFRKNEAAALKWKRIDFERGIIILPSTKNGESHVFPMGDYLALILKERRAESEHKYVFASRTGDRPITASTKAFNRIAEKSGVSFCLHDLRRTYATTAAEIGIDAYTLKRLLNHKTSGDVTAGYLNLSISSLRESAQKVENAILDRVYMPDKVMETPVETKSEKTKPTRKPRNPNIVWDFEMPLLGVRTEVSGLQFYVVAHLPEGASDVKFWLLGARNTLKVEAARKMATNLIANQSEVTVQ